MPEAPPDDSPDPFERQQRKRIWLTLAAGAIGGATLLFLPDPPAEAPTPDAVSSAPAAPAPARSRRAASTARTPTAPSTPTAPGTPERTTAPSPDEGALPQSFTVPIGGTKSIHLGKNAEWSIEGDFEARQEGDKLLIEATEEGVAELRIGDQIIELTAVPVKAGQSPPFNELPGGNK